MKSNIVQAINKLKQARELFEDFQRELPNSKGSQLAERYKAKIDWIFTDLVSHPHFSDEVRNGIRNEWNGDVFAIDALTDKAGLLTPEKRLEVEDYIDGLLMGK